MLGVDGFVSAMCTPYATPQTVADSLATYGSAYRSCYSFLGKTQPGVNTTDPSDPSACVPDPGGAPPGKQGPVSDNWRRSQLDFKDAVDVTPGTAKRDQNRDHQGHEDAFEPR